MNPIAVVGPTASGKSALGIALAHEFGGEVVNVDSMQLYRGMDIGTAKVTEAEREEMLRQMAQQQKAAQEHLTMEHGAERQSDDDADKPQPVVAGFDEQDPATWGNPSRNDPCPCGSGKKFKHCHGAI